MSPRFLKIYADLAKVTTEALGVFRREVETGVYPAPEHTYQIDDGELTKLLQQMRA